jgi:hypothetical protein
MASGVQAGQDPAAGDQRGAARLAWQQRQDLAAPRRKLLAGRGRRAVRDPTSNRLRIQPVSAIEDLSALLRGAL